jgi:hypothetical protein
MLGSKSNFEQNAAFCGLMQGEKPPRWEFDFFAFGFQASSRECVTWDPAAFFAA